MSANLANAIVKLTAVEALPLLLQNLIVGNLVRRDFEPVTAECGDSVSVQTPQSDVSVNLDRMAKASFCVPDVTRVIAVPDLLRLYMQPAMEALAEKVESDLLCLYNQFTANDPIGAAGCGLKEDYVSSADTALSNSGVPAAEPKYLVVSSKAYSQLRQIERFSEYNSAGDAGLRALVDGPIGKLHNFYVMRSRHIQTSTNGGGQNLAFTRDAMCLAMRRLPRPLPGAAVAEYAELGNFGLRVLMHYEPNTLQQKFTVSLLYGCGVLRNDHGVQVRS